MRKNFLWIIPTLILTICIAYNNIFGILKINIKILEFIAFVFGVYGMVFMAPCFYVYLINKNSFNKTAYIKSTLYSILYIGLNAIIANPMSLLYYIGVNKRECHDLDLFPMYVIIPLIIVFVGSCMIQIIKLIKKKRDKL